MALSRSQAPSAPQPAPPPQVISKSMGAPSSPSPAPAALTDLPKVSRAKVSSSGRSHAVEADKPGPSPGQFDVLRSRRFYRTAPGPDLLLVEIRYRGVNHFEGRKILLFGDSKAANDMINARHLDPHFDQGSTLIARFVPTEAGWRLAGQLADTMSQSGCESELLRPPRHSGRVGHAA